jgi:surfeit locus 1 family protein
VLLGILSSLGFWQLHRAEQTRALLGKYNEPSRSSIRLEPHLSSFEGLQFESAEASGNYDRDHQFLLDNMTHNGHVGYHVLTPFRLGNSGVAVLVNRGWIPLGGTRAKLPDPAVGGERRLVVGRIKVPATETFMLGEEEQRKGWPYRIQRIRISALEQELGYPLLPVVLLLDEQQDDGFVREWRPIRFGPERNIGYAVQWFGLALTLFIIFVAVNTRKAT